jgi:hypothetical protein
MADFSISITVTGSIGGQSFSWSRTATVANIDAAIYGLNSSIQTTSGLGSDSAGGFAVDGHHDYTGVAVACFVHNNPGTILWLNPIDPTGTVYAGVLMPPNLPMIYYGGAGTGFTGSFNASNSATDTPTVDMVGAINATQFIGSGSITALYGLKAVS